MTTPWDRITDKNYKSWLSDRQVDASEYNQASLLDRSSLRTQFEQQHPQQVGRAPRGLGEEPSTATSNSLLLGVKRMLEASMPTPIETPASLGEETIETLRENNLIRELAAVDGGSPLLDVNALETLETMTKEHHVVTFLTPIFEKALIEIADIRVVNSEEYPWLVTSRRSTKFNQKPDNIFCNEAIYSRRNPFETNDEVLLALRTSKERYGILSRWELRDCIDVAGEAKVCIDNKAVGEVVNYARHLCYNNGPDRVKLILYDKTKFWLIHVVQGSISLVETCGWTVPGSTGHLIKFFRNGRSPWIKLLLSACDHFSVHVSHDSFLGMGTFGRVFRVRSQESSRATFSALKLVLAERNGSGRMQLWKEKQCLENAALVCPNEVVHVSGFVDDPELGAAMLLSHVGGKVTRGLWRQTFLSLGRLHEANIVHGDSRISNCVSVEGSVRWIDFRASAVVTPDQSAFKRRDMKLLLDSCLAELSMSTQTDDLTQGYDGTEASAKTIFDGFKGFLDSFHGTDEEQTEA